MLSVMNLTVSVDERVVERARQVALRQGTSLNALVRAYLEALAGVRSPAQIAADLRAQWSTSSGDSKGASLRREDAYDGRT
jgi:hypothetical protein